MPASATTAPTDEVDAADEDHQRHAEGEDRVDGNLLGQIEQISRCEEAVLRHPERKITSNSAIAASRGR